MNTIAWMVDADGETYVLALHRDVALLVRGEQPGEVWQFRRREKRAAIDRIIHETSILEEGGAEVGDPVEFDLTDEAIWDICRSTEFTDWFDAPALREELMAAVDEPRWTGPVVWTATPPSDWVPVGYVDEGVSFTSTAPPDPAVGDVWIKP